MFIIFADLADWTQKNSRIVWYLWATVLVRTSRVKLTSRESSPSWTPMPVAMFSLTASLTLWPERVLTWTQLSKLLTVSESWQQTSPTSCPRSWEESCHQTRQSIVSRGCSSTLVLMLCQELWTTWASQLLCMESLTCSLTITRWITNCYNYRHNVLGHLVPYINAP